MQGKREEIATRVRELRECSDLTAAEVAAQVHITEAEYAAMEAGQADYPVSLLYEIADVLKTDLVTLLTGRDANMRSFSVTRAGAGVEIKRRADYGYQALSPNFLGKKCEPLFVTVPAGAGRPRGNSHPGQEFDYLLSGTMKIYIHDQEIVLNVGDCIYFDATQEHAMEAIGKEPAQFIAVIL